MRWLRAGFLPFSLLILFAAAWTVPLPFYIERPGRLLSLSEAVSVDAPEVGELNGDFLLTAVSLRPATVVGLGRALADRDVAVVQRTQFIPPDIDDAAYFERQRSLFATTADVAAAMGLGAAGFDVDPDDLTGDGVLVVSTMPGTPAEGVLESGDVIVRVGERPVATTADLFEAVSADTAVALRFDRDGEERSVELVPEIREVEGQSRPIIGVQIETLRPRIDLPIDVRVDSGRIGGPSAGLMIALTVFDKASADVDLTAGRNIGGTGALHPDGTVRPIGGVRQKVAAAARDGLDVFLVPAEQIDVATQAAPPGMRVVGVTSFDDAVQALTDDVADDGRGSALALAA